MPSNDTFDALVIGAGHNGLVAANYLADAGLAVVVVEAAATVGGMTSSGCTIPGAPEHVVNHCAVDAVFWSVFAPSRELRLEDHGLRWVTADPALVYLHPDGESVAIWRDARKTADEVRHYSPADADAYLELARFLDALFDIGTPVMGMNPTRPAPRVLAKAARQALRHRHDARAALPFLLAPAGEIIDERFEHEITRGMLHSIASLIGPADQPNTSLAFLSTVVMHRVPALRPVGGMQAIPDALVTRLRAKGGQVLTSAPVAEITVAGGRADGVTLADGRRLRATRAVLATCDPHQTMTRLLPHGTLDETMARRVRSIPTRQGGHGMLKLDLALSGHLTVDRHQAKRRDGLDLREPSHLIGTADGLARAYAQAGAGLLPAVEDLGFWNSLPAALDPTQAPAGMDSLYVWTTQVPIEPNGGWDGVVEGYAKQVVAGLADLYPRIEELEIARTIETTRDLERRTGATDGNLSHVDFALSRMGPLRPARGLGGYRTPIEGLYLGGAGSSPGGGVTGAAGHLAAMEILRKRRRAR